MIDTGMKSSMYVAETHGTASVMIIIIVDTMDTTLIQHYSTVQITAAKFNNFRQIET